MRALSDNERVTDLESILSQWRKLEAGSADYVLATVVRVEGPSYRKPGALMLPFWVKTCVPLTGELVTSAYTVTV